jgi:hypothetical protein
MRTSRAETIGHRGRGGRPRPEKYSLLYLDRLAGGIGGDHPGSIAWRYG